MPNTNQKTGIHYGVIPKNDLFNCAEEFFNNAIDISYDESLNKLKNNIKALIKDVMPEDTIEEILDLVEERFKDTYESDCAQLRYEQNGYILESNNDDPDLFVIESPYYTLAPPCSPCAPRAGYLRDANKGEPYTTYCLPKEWFEDDKCPYEYWLISPAKAGD